MAALSDFPHFSSARELFKALREQGFSVSKRGPGYRVQRGSGRVVFIHSGSLTDRSGARSRNALSELVGIGFLPPADYAYRQWLAKQRRAAEHGH